MAEENKNQFLSKAGLQTLWKQIAANFDQVYVFEPGKINVDDLDPIAVTTLFNELSGAYECNKTIIVNDDGIVPATKLGYGEEGILTLEYIKASNRNTVVRYTITGSHVTYENVDLLSNNNILQQQTPFDLEYVPGNSSGEKPTIYLKVNGERKGSGIDVSDFIADGMLDDTNIITVTESDADLIAAGYAIGTKLIKFIWKGVVDESGNPKADYIRVSDLAVDPDTSNTEVAENIIIAGGPLESELKTIFTSKDADGNVIIPKGTSLQDLLTLLACKEMWPTSISTADAKVISTAATPTIAKSTTSTEVEVGTTLSFTAKNGASTGSATGHKASGFTYGYSAADDNSKDSSNTSVEGNKDTVVVDLDESTLTVTAPKDGGGTQTLTEIGTSEAGSAVIDYSFNAIEGTNSVSAQATSATHLCAFGALPEYYGCSNTGKTHDGTGKTYKSTAKSATGKSSVAVTSSKATWGVTGKYKWFMGCSDATLVSELDSAKVRALSKNGWVTKDGTTTIVSSSSSWESDGRSIIIACPAKYKLASVTDSMGNDYMGLFPLQESEVSVTTGAINTSYKIYIYKITNGTVMKLKGITLTKA